MFIKLADIIVYQIFGLAAETKLGSSLHFFVYDVFKILFLLFSIILIISFLRSYIDNNKFKKYIEKQPKLLAHLLASVFGAVTPFCSCSSIPLFIGFIEAGIPFGVAMSFLITSPMINEIAMLVLAGILGVKFTLIYISTGILVGTIGGFIMEKLGFQKYLQEYLEILEKEPLKWKVLIKLLAVTGARRGEILGLKWNKINFKENTIYIDNNLLYTQERGIYEESGLPMHPDSVTNYCRKLQNKYNIKIKEENKELPETKQKREIKLSPHIFRHSQASILIFMKVDPVTVSKRLGHSQVSTTSDIYSHIMKKADEGAAETLSQVLR